MWDVFAPRTFSSFAAGRPTLRDFLEAVSLSYLLAPFSMGKWPLMGSAEFQKHIRNVKNQSLICILWLKDHHKCLSWLLGEVFVG
jgi:hypothetical protein